MEPWRIQRLTEELQSATYHEQGFKLCLEIGGVTIALYTDSQSLLLRLSSYFKNFMTLGNPDASLFVKTVSSTDLWEDDDSEFTIAGNQVFQRDFSARLMGQERAVAVMAPELDDAFHNLLRWFLPPFLLKKGCFLMHAAGVAKLQNGIFQGYVFFGQSGAGKSTTANLIAQSDPGAVLLGDDGVIIGADERGRVRLFSAPLGCGYSREAPPPLSVPLAGIYALEQGASHGIFPLETSEAVAAILASAMSVKFSDSIEERFQLALLFSEMTQKLRFKKDAGFWPMVLETHQNRGKPAQAVEVIHVSE